MEHPNREATIRAITRTCRGRKVDGRFGGCGADINALILAQPLDGQVHEANCPECGAPHHWRAADLGEGAEEAGEE